MEHTHWNGDSWITRLKIPPKEGKAWHKSVEQRREASHEPSWMRKVHETFAEAHRENGPLEPPGRSGVTRRVGPFEYR